MRRPQRDASQRALEVADGRHGDRVDHLLVEQRIGFRRGHAILREHPLLIQIDRRVGDATRRVDVDHLEVLAAGPSLRLGSHGTVMVISPMPARSNCIARLGSKVKMRRLRETGAGMRLSM